MRAHTGHGGYSEESGGVTTRGLAMLTFPILFVVAVLEASHGQWAPLAAYGASAVVAGLAYVAARRSRRHDDTPVDPT